MQTFLFCLSFSSLAESDGNKGFLSLETQLWGMHIKNMYKILGEKKNV